MKKVLVWDGDETLWDGTIVDGDNPYISEEKIEHIKELHSRGVVQSIASKNILADVLDVLNKYNISDYFIAPQADFERSKSQMISSIKELLGLTKYSDFVFLDDQEFNLFEVEENCEGIIVSDVGRITSLITSHFTKENYTKEDRNRVQLYKSEIERRKVSESHSGDYIDFLSSCNMEMEVFHPKDEDIERFCDLIVRANRLSALSMQFKKEDILAIHNKDLSHSFDENYKISNEQLVACRVKDKYGDYGICGLAIVKKMLWGEIVIIGFVISCRMQGKGIGSSLLGSIINNSKIGVRAIWNETKYNAGMRKLYEWYKFKISEQSNFTTASFDKESRYAVSLPPWIDIETKLNI
tara:strand:- start:76659 stop:77720 length:1062 start_codon:yes stop_codon:yes gene_type:complete